MTVIAQRPLFSGSITWELNSPSETDALEGRAFRKFKQRVETELKPTTVITLKGGYNDVPNSVLATDPYQLQLTHITMGHKPDGFDSKTLDNGPMYYQAAGRNWAQQAWDSWVALPRFFDAVMAKAQFEERRPVPKARPKYVA